jgi:hypothetical protein
MLFDYLFHLVGPLGSSALLVTVLGVVIVLFSIGRHFRKTKTKALL